MIDQTFGHEMGELAVHRAARLAASLDNVGEAHRFFGKGDKLQKRDGLTKRAGYAFLFSLHGRNHLMLAVIWFFVIGHGNIHRHLS
ncbi:hypothetical protein D3C80_2070690 [compost metagenome]